MKEDSIIQQISDKQLLLWLSLLWLINISVRLVNLEAMPVYLDESIRGYIMWNGAQGNFLPISDYYFSTPLELFVILPFVVLGDSILIGRIAIVIVSSLMVPVLYLLREDMTNHGVVITSTLLSLIPAFVMYQRVWKGDGIVLTLFLVFVVFLFRYKRTKKKRHIALAGMTLGLSFLSKATALIFTGIFVSYALLLMIARFTQDKRVQNVISSTFRNGMIVLLFIATATITATIGWVWAVWLSSPSARFPDIIIQTITKIIDLYFGELSRGTTAEERSFIYFFEFMTSRWYLWFIGLGIACAAFVLFRIRDSGFEGNVGFYRFTMYWTILALIVHSAMTYAYPRHSQYFLIPLALTCGVLGDLVVYIVKWLRSAFLSMRTSTPKNQKSNRFAGNLLPVLLLTFIIINGGILSLSALPGISRDYPRDVRKDASDFTLSILNRSQDALLIQIDESSYPWRWHFRSILESGCYFFIYSDTFEREQDLLNLLDEHPEAFYLICTDIFSEAVVSDFVTQYEDAIPDGMSTMTEWFHPTEGYAGEQLILYYG
jgi:uncharacterized protein (TIGR03663 family)